MRVAAPIALVLALGCVAPQTVANRTDLTVRNYEGGGEVTATVGSPFVASERTIRGRVNTGQWVGLLNSPDGYLWVNAELIQRHELVYSGRDGSTLLVAYREYQIENTGQNVGNSNLYARPAYSQDLRYDLGASDMIVFRAYRVKVIEANNEHVRVRVLADETGSLEPLGHDRVLTPSVAPKPVPSPTPTGESEYERGRREERERYERERVGQ